MKNIVQKLLIKSGAKCLGLHKIYNFILPKGGGGGGGGGGE